MRSTRRRFLASTAASAVGLAGLAGCSAPDGSTNGNGTSTADGSSDVTPVPDPNYDLSVTHDVESWDGYDPDWSPPTDPPTLDVEIETVIEGLEIPWDLAFAPDGDLFVTERVGRISRYDSSTLETVATADVIDHADSIAPGEEGGWWEAGSEGGLMGLAVHPNYPDVPLVYAIYTYEGEAATPGGDPYVNRLSYFDVSADDPGETETVVIDPIPGNEIIHNGSRIAFGPANHLWVTTGDAGSMTDVGTDDPLPQDPSSLAGKVLRLEPDGSAPDGNPDIGGDPRVYTYGHRNPQGIDFLPDGTPIVTEHGPANRDEVMVLRPGENHGWGSEDERARDGETYPGTDYARPVVNTGPDEGWAPPGCVFYTGDGVPSWSNRLLVGGLASQRVNIVTVYPADGEPASAATGGTRYDADWMNEDYDAVAHHTLADELGRIRHLEQGPNGDVYAITSNRDGRADDGFPKEGDDRLVRITPA
ncbi:sorbosone dehydrogenase family protein [Halopenitus sp. H-Gu1]|uniref:PQQ-dependent sugar dehydrogenase n=1 Tax=Halopenitus sp. H-Gu1 TaxID=3242697 RepID=UPI00359CCCEA